MATTINKQRLLTHLFTAARKAVEAEPELDEPRPVLHEFIYALCRGDRPHRPTSPPQPCERFSTGTRCGQLPAGPGRGLRRPAQRRGRAERLSAFLREAFETEFSFDLDKQLLKKGLELEAEPGEHERPTTTSAPG